MCVCVSDNKNQSSDVMTKIGLFIKGTLVKYWIFCCCFMFFIISFSDKVAVYKILYICLFLFCVVLYEVSSFVSQIIAVYICVLINVDMCFCSGAV